MSILILNRNAPYPFDKWLKDCNEQLVILTTHKRAEEINYGITKGFSNYENNGFVEMVAAELNKHYHFSSVVATSEFDIYRAGAIREFLRIKGQQTTSALSFRNKVIMKEVLVKKGIKVPAFSKINSSIDIFTFIENNGFPIIIKPIDGSGSEGVTYFDNYEDVKAYVSKNILTNLEIESFIPGDMYHIDGLVLNGEVVFSWPSQYVNGCLSHQGGDFNGSFQLNQENPLTNRLKDYVKDVLQCLPTPQNTSFHLEVFHTPEDELIFCEAACRRGGGYIRQAIIQTFGIDLTKCNVQAQSGLEVSFPKKENIHKYCGFVLMPIKDGKLMSLPDNVEMDWITEHTINGVVGETYEQSESSLDNLASFLIEGNSEEDLINKINWTAEWFENNTEWSIQPIREEIKN